MSDSAAVPLAGKCLFSAQTTTPMDLDNLVCVGKLDFHNLVRVGALGFHNLGFPYRKAELS